MQVQSQVKIWSYTRKCGDHACRIQQMSLCSPIFSYLDSSHDSGGAFFWPFLPRKLRSNCRWKLQRWFEQARFRYVTLTYTAWHRLKANTSAYCVAGRLTHFQASVFVVPKIPPPAIVGCLFFLHKVVACTLYPQSVFCHQFEKK